LPTWAIIVTGGLLGGLTLLSFWVTATLTFLIPLLAFSGLGLSLARLRKQRLEESLQLELGIEKNLSRQNEIQGLIETKLMRSRVLQDKYLTYYNLRKSIERLTPFSSFPRLCHSIALQAFEFIKKGDQVLFLLGAPDASEIQVIAGRSLDSERIITDQKGDFFDLWVVKNRQPLLIQDIEQDFRFNIGKKSLARGFESVLAAPLFLEANGVGVVRINSSKKSTFGQEDLRLLQVFADIASTALINSILYTQTEELAIRDSLTGLFVYHYFKQRLKEECERSLSDVGRPFSLIFLDIDHFKNFNDSYGHPSGDLALKKLSALIQEELGSEGLVARYGGEEFGLILPECDGKTGAKRAERLRTNIEKFSITIRDQDHRFTLSGGVAEFPRDARKEEDLIQVADQRLYRAKKRGRNQICGPTS